MYKSVFQSSKMALLFAGLTLVSAVSMVGTPDNNGVVTEAVDRIESGRTAFANDARAYAEARSQGDAPPAEAPVFGDFESAAASAPTGATPNSAQSMNPMNAPRSATAVTAPPGVPYISDREMTLEPE